MTKTRVFSGIQPSGKIHLGNHLGTMKNWVKMQDEYDCIFCVVDQHALTAQPDPEDLRTSILSTAASFIASGIDIDKSVIYQQSMLHQHAQLQWALMTVARTGWLNRMTQYKAKSGCDFNTVKERVLADKSVEEPMDLIGATFDVIEEMGDSISAGIYTYPVLMAADILLFNATHVPVGEDQIQHLQLTRQIAQSFNSQYKTDLFNIPQDIVPETAARVMSLRYPENKMSKSQAESEQELIFLTDTADEIAKKVKRATTDPERITGDVKDLDARAGAKNLLSIYAALSEKPLEAVCEHFDGEGFGTVKKELTDLLVEEITPIGNGINQLMEDPESIRDILLSGADHLSDQADDMIETVYDLMGIY